MLALAPDGLQTMQLSIINALLMTLTTLLFGAVIVWGTAVNMRAVTSENARRREQGLPPVPLWYESLWKSSPKLVLSAVYIAFSVAFALYLLDFAASSILKLKSGPESPYQLYQQCTPTAFWIGCGIWLTPLLAAMLSLFGQRAVSSHRQPTPVTRQYVSTSSVLISA